MEFALKEGTLLPKLVNAVIAVARMNDVDVRTINEYIDKVYSDSEFRDSSNRSKSLKSSNDYCSCF